jgi:ubiquinone/menaquinone biosynthesis C-methylase UbiE
MTMKRTEGFGERYFESCESTSILKDRKPLYHRFWVRYIRKHKKDGRLLDVGCGKGFFLKYAKKSYETYGIDISEFAIEKSRERLDSPRLYVGDVTHLAFSAGYFDIVTCFDVLEHVDNPTTAVKECERVLAGNGLLIVSVPNTESLGLKLNKQRWFGYRDPKHVSLLSTQEWVNLVQACGFEIVDEFYDGLWDSPYSSKLPAFVQHFMFKIPFTLLFPVLGIFGIIFPKAWGENIIIVARKMPNKEQ